MRVRAMWLCLAVLALASGPAVAEQSCPKLDCTDLPNGEYPNPESCTSFCYCVWGKSVLTNCAKMNNGDRLHFNPSLKVCDWPQNAGCKIGTDSAEPKAGG